MKKYALPLAIASTLALQACHQSTQESGESTDAGAREVALDNQTQRLSYGMAYGLGQRLASDEVPLDIAAFTAGLQDAVDGGEPRMTEEEIQAEMQTYQEQAMAEQQAEQAALAEANQAEAEKFLTENADREGVVVTESGLQYEVIEEGEGGSPGPEDTVEVHYTGTLLDGTEFDSSHKRGEPVTFGVTQVIPGWTEALQLMSPGSKYKLYIPSDLAYGEGGAGGVIGPNSALIFDVELLSVPSQQATAEDDASLESDATDEG